VFDRYITALQLHVAQPCGTDLTAIQTHAHDKFIAQFVVKTGAAVYDSGGSGRLLFHILSLYQR
jgi:hypothetical protein